MDNTASGGNDRQRKYVLCFHQSTGVNQQNHHVGTKNTETSTLKLSTINQWIDKATFTQVTEHDSIQWHPIKSTRSVQINDNKSLQLLYNSVQPRHYSQIAFLDLPIDGTEGILAYSKGKMWWDGEHNMLRVSLD